MVSTTRAVGGEHTRATPARRAWAGWAWPGAAALVAAVVTSWDLSRSSITLVETATVSAAVRPVSKLPALLGNTDAVLAPYYAVMHFWLRLGHGLWWMRLPGVFACAATAALLVVVGRRLSPVAGIAAGLLFAVSADASRYAEDARPYAFAMLGATVATWRLLVAVERPARRNWLWYGAALVFLGAVHLFALLLLPAHAWYARRRLSAWAVSVAGALVVLSPLLVYGAGQVSGELSWAERPGLHSLRALVGELSGSAALTVVLGVLLVMGAVTLWSGERDLALLLVGWLAVPPVLLFAVSQAHAVFASRYLAFTTPALCLLAAAGLTALRKPMALAAVVLVVALLVPAQLQLRRAVGHDTNNMALMAHELTTLTRAGDGIVYEPSTARRIFAGYAKAPAGRDVLLLASPQASDTLSGSNIPTSQLRERLAAAQRLWVVRVTDRNIGTSPLYADANNFLRGYRQIRKIPLAGGSITLYVPPA